MGTEIVNVDCNGVEIPVVVEYVTEIDRNYGADADGNRGTVLMSREILDASIDHEYLAYMTVGDVEYVLDQARFIFANRTR